MNINNLETVVGSIRENVNELERIARSLKASSYRAKEMGLEDKEIFDRFFEEICIFDEASRVNSTEFWQAFKAWLKENAIGNPFVSQKAFGGYLGSLPFLARCKTKGRIFYSGIRFVWDEGNP